MKYFLLLLLFFPSLAFGTEYRIAILDFRAVGVEDEALLSSLSDSVRAGLVKTIDQDEYLVMTRESTMQILKDMGKDASCMEGSCEVEIARNIGADYVVSGTVTLISGTYLVTLKLHNTKTNALLSSEQLENKEALALIKQMGGAGQQLLYEGKIGAKPVETNFQGGFSGGAEQEWTAGVAGESIIVRFESIPSGEGSVVLVDGKVICTRTPCSKSVPVGIHNVSVQRDQYYAWSERRNFDEEQSVQADLKPTFGTLKLTAGKTHNVKFLLNDEPVYSPLNEKQLKEGQYTLKLDDSCYSGVKGQEYNFEIASAEKKEITFPITPVPAGIEISVRDEDGNDLDAEIFIDKNYLGETPNRFDIPVCTHEIEIRYEGIKEVLFPELEKEELNIIAVELDIGAYKKRKEREKMAIYKPMWNITLGYRQGHDAIITDRELLLDNGFIVFEDGGHILNGAVSTQEYFDQKNSYGFQTEIGVMWEQWYGEMDIAYVALPENQLHPTINSLGADSPLILSFNSVDFGFEGGYVAPWPYLRPRIGLGLGLDMYTADILEVGSSDYWLEQGVIPYSLVSNDTNSDGEPLTPKFERIFPYIGISTGLLIQHPWWDELPLGMYVNSGLKLNQTSIQTNFGVSLLLQIPLDT